MARGRYAKSSPLSQSTRTGHERASGDAERSGPPRRGGKRKQTGAIESRLQKVTGFLDDIGIKMHDFLAGTFGKPSYETLRRLAADRAAGKTPDWVARGSDEGINQALEKASSDAAETNKDVAAAHEKYFPESAGEKQADGTSLGDMGRKYLEDAKGTLEGAKGTLGRAEGAFGDAKGILGDAKGLFTEVAGISRSAWDSFTKYGEPMLEALSESLAPGAERGRISQAEGLAAADVSQSYDMADADLRRSLGRYNIQPGSGSFTAAMRNLALGRAADTAGAKTTARVGVLDRIRSERANLAGLASNIGLAGMSGLSTAASGVAGVGQGMAGIAQGLAGVGSRMADIGRAEGSLASLGVSAGQRDRALDLQEAGLKSDIDLRTRALDINEKFGQSNIDAQRRSDKWGTIGSIIGTGASFLFSDRRVKRNIVKIGDLNNDIGVYEFNFIDDADTTYTGVMADEVSKVMPQHVAKIRGIYAVDYAGVLRDL